jgi:hypothetical protein
MDSSRLRGHALQHEGKPYAPGEEYPWLRVYGSPSGVALCECGKTSPVLESDAARKRWHAGHKAEVRASVERVRRVITEEAGRDG